MQTNSFKGDLNIEYIKNGSFIPILAIQAAAGHQYFKDKKIDIFNDDVEDWDLDPIKLLKYMKPIVSVRHKTKEKSHYYEIAFRRCQISDFIKRGFKID